jgi:hypothetical protein
MTATRRLAAILPADVAGYSRLIGAAEEGTLNRFKATLAELIDPKTAEHIQDDRRPHIDRISGALWRPLPTRLKSRHHLVSIIAYSMVMI